MKYRLGNSLDVPAVLNLLAEMAKNGRIGPKFHWTKQSLEDELWKYHFVIASAEDQYLSTENSDKPQSQKVGGFIIYRFLSEKLIEINSLATSDHYLRKNIMKNLMTFLIEVEKPEEIWLEVHESNLAAIQFYEKMGFIKVGQREKYYSDDATAYNYAWKSTAV